MDQQRFSGLSGALIRFLHHADYAWFLPLLARIPLSAGYFLADLRGRLNARLGRDWRSMALGTRHVARQSAAGYRLLYPQTTEKEMAALVQERFKAESLEEFEGCLMAAGRIAKLQHEILPEVFLTTCKQRNGGMVLLTLHFESFLLGVLFLAQNGIKVNVMTSSVTRHPQVARAVQNHFFNKYRGMERYLNGGKMLDMEEGLRPFYQLLKRGECLVVLADAPAVAGGAVATPCFLGKQRQLAGGALRLAQKTDSAIGAFTCRLVTPGSYLVKGGPVLSSHNPQALDVIYRFLSDEIEATPGKWQAVDLLPLMTPIESGE
ncbi:MAG: hypothetical protein RBR43_07860 [Desulfuromonadaceae bacterium]|nr:hypothetical protein [Desulfuromonadaceae bacterium]